MVCELITLKALGGLGVGKGSIQLKSNKSILNSNVSCFPVFVFQTSCAQIQQLVPNAISGYYWVHIKGKKVQVYCDMDNYGMNVLR